jgi:hypothetical protein
MMNNLRENSKKCGKSWYLLARTEYNNIARGNQKGGSRMTKATWVDALNRVNMIQAIAQTNGGTWEDGYRGVQIKVVGDVIFANGKEFAVKFSSQLVQVIDYVLANVIW